MSGYKGQLGLIAPKGFSVRGPVRRGYGEKIDIGKDRDRATEGDRVAP